MTKHQADFIINDDASSVNNYLHRGTMDKPFNLWLRDEIASRGQTQREFAKQLDIDESNVSNYILGKRIPNTRTLIRIVLALHNGGKQAELVRLLMQSLQGIENMELR